jgi:XTP/dITP diphosphohydrolase
MSVLRIATTNAGKLREIKALLKNSSWDIRGIEDLSAYDVTEDGSTCAENAAKKALACFARTQQPCVADDSGLMVEALNGLPGVHSARYAVAPSLALQDSFNRAKLLSAMQHHAQRDAYFICVLAFCNAPNSCMFFEGRLTGTIAYEERGSDGFGYDSVFIPTGSSRTLAEHSLEEKNRISHRKKALDACAAYLAQHGTFTALQE